MPRTPFKTCRFCRSVTPDAEYREGYYVILCAACHLDMGRKVSEEYRHTPDTRVTFPKETGVLKYKAGRVSGGQQGGGR